MSTRPAFSHGMKQYGKFMNTTVAFSRPVAKRLAEFLDKKQHYTGFVHTINQCLEGRHPVVAIATTVAHVKQLKEWLELDGTHAEAVKACQHAIEFPHYWF